MGRLLCLPITAIMGAGMKKAIINGAINAALVLVFLLGLAIMLYPTISNMINTKINSERIIEYENMVTNLTLKDYTDIVESVNSYNQRLARREIEEDNDEYNELLFLDPSGIMGYIEIPKINTRLAIYHGISESVLQIGVGHLPQSSLPMGGSSTHCVLSGHRGLPSAKLFSDLGKLVVGDVFYIYVLDEILAYQIDDIRTVEPDDVSTLSIYPDADLVTLVTCTPYGINTHRLLVRGVRVEYKKTLAQKQQYQADAYLLDPNTVAAVIGSIILTIIFSFVFVNRLRKSGNGKKNKKSEQEGSDKEKSADEK